MKYFHELTILPEPEMTLGFLWQKVFAQIHLALVSANRGKQSLNDIGIAFPEYGNARFGLGRKVRLFAADREKLEDLQIDSWLSRFVDYVHIKPTQETPTNVTYASFVRQRIKGKARIEKDMLQKAQLKSKYTGIPFEQCLADFRKSIPKSTKSLPFVWVQSLHKQQSRRFPLFIQKVERPYPNSGSFTCYGLSQPTTDPKKLATVPQF